MKKWMKKTIAMVLAFSLFIDPALFPKAAYAWDEYDSSVCKQIDSDKASGDPEKSPPQDAYNECQNAQLAHKVYGAAIAKSIIFGVAGAVCAAAAYFEWAGSSTICQGIDAGAMAFDLIMSQVFKRDAESTVGKVASFINMAEGIAVFKLGSNVISSLSGTASAGASSSGQGECIASAIALFLLMGLAIWDTIEAQSLASKHLANAKSMKEAYDLRNRVNTTYGGTTGNTVNPGSAPGSSGTTDGGSASDPCVGKTGNDYLKCLGQEAHDPQLSAIADNPALDKLLTPVLGKSLGDFVKGYNGNGSADSIKDYVANGIGLSA
ncbi:MAG: hypothetical protein EBX52_14215, partial [Proteobacteria bacterium]|nr:hypothetical protein [Pseudomonadota bacterium]